MSPPAIYDSEAIQRALALPADERRKLVTKISVQQGVTAAALVSALWVPTMAFLHWGKSGPSKWFQTNLNMSAKTAVLIMPILLGFGVVSEQVATRLANPQLFTSAISDKRVSALNPPQRLANFVHDNPIRTLIMVGVPGVMALFLSKGGQTELTLSQRIMHTRVAGQFSVLMTLLGVMGVHDYMSKRGRFLEPWEQEAMDKLQAEAKLEEERSKVQHH